MQPSQEHFTTTVHEKQDKQSELWEIGKSTLVSIEFSGSFIPFDALVNLQNSVTEAHY